jgi:hypothetical protein
LFVQSERAREIRRGEGRIGVREALLRVGGLRLRADGERQRQQ